MSPETPIIILLFHGSRHSQSALEAADLARELSQRGDSVVTVAFLQMVSPLLPDVLKCAFAEGRRRIRVFPLFTLTGAHVAHDIPSIINEFRNGHPACRIDLEPHLAADPSFREWLIRRVFNQEGGNAHD